MPITQFNCSKQSCKTVLMTSDEQYVDSMREVAGMRVWVRTDVTLCMNSVRNYNTDVTLCIRDPESWIGDWLLSQSRSGTVPCISTDVLSLAKEIFTYRRICNAPCTRHLRDRDGVCATCYTIMPGPDRTP